MTVELVYQTRFGAGGPGVGGNCVAACYATILGIPLEEVPELCAEDQAQREEAFLRSRGLGRVYVCIPRKVPPEAIVWPSADAVYMLSGTSPRGFGHRVVAVDGEIVHDPHPEGGGLDQVRAAIFIVPLTATVTPRLEEASCS